MPKVHDLKSWPALFIDAALGQKNFEVRRNDRDFKVGEHLRLREWDPATQEYTTREIERRITYIFDASSLLAGENTSVLAAGFVVLGVVPVPYGQSLTQDQRPEHVRA